MQFRKVLTTSTIVLASSLSLTTFAGPAVPPKTGATLEEVRASVEQYYESAPQFRPTERWLPSLNPSLTCSMPRYPLAGLRQELEGTTALSFNISTEGKPVDVRLLKSSGWAVLDEAAFEALATCNLVPVSTETQSASYRFDLQ